MPILRGEDAASKTLDPAFSSGFDRTVTFSIIILDEHRTSLFKKVESSLSEVKNRKKKQKK